MTPQDSDSFLDEFDFFDDEETVAESVVAAPRNAGGEAPAEGEAGALDETGRRRRRRRRRRGRGGNTGAEGTGEGTSASAEASAAGAPPAGSGAGTNSPSSGRGAASEARSGGRAGGGREQQGEGGGRRRRRRRSGGGGESGAGAGSGQRGSNVSVRDRGGRDRGRPQREQRPREQHDPRDTPERDSNEPVTVGFGILELHPKGYGFLRDHHTYLAGKDDPFVTAAMIDKHKLREGIIIKGEITEGSRSQGPRLKTILEIDGRSLEDYAKIKPFDSLTAINPFEQIKLETGATPVTMRVMDLLTPIGKGQRALIVAPPRTGKTMLLQEIANSVSANHPELHLMVLLIDERPEEVTEMRRRIKGEVIASSMDREVESHVRMSQLVMERGKRLAEAGHEVFILWDSITRTARAFNKWIGNSGRTGTGGLDVKAMDIPRKMFGTARRFDEGGSLTIVATALIDTGSRMDEAIFQEFKGTGNMELVLNRQLAERRIWPAMDIGLSGTRREEKILPPEVLDGVTMLRRSLVSLGSVEAMEQLTRTLARFPSNKEFLAKIRAVM